MYNVNALRLVFFFFFILHLFLIYVGKFRFLNFLISGELIILSIVALLHPAYEGCTSGLVLFICLVLVESSVLVTSIVRLNRCVSSGQCPLTVVDF